MYRALYRKWRPRRFEDVVGQTAVVATLKNQVKTNHVGHAYLFTGTRGTGKTTCAKIFSKAINCPNITPDGDPCCECEICRGIEDGSILDVIEMDAASNNSVNDVRDIRDEAAYTPSNCKYKVYIIDEVHMLSVSAFNALLKTLEEPPSHVVFILATTEIHKVPATILSRCQRYDFRHIQPEDICGRVAYVAEQEKIQLTPDACSAIAMLAKGALRDALSILDTCAGSSSLVDLKLVQQMTGITDKGYLFRLSDQLAKGDSASVIEIIAELRKESLDMKRVAEELVSHFRNLMLIHLPRGAEFLTDVSDTDLLNYQNDQAVSQNFAIQAISVLGDAIDKMRQSNDPRIELELALLKISAGLQMPATVQQTAAFSPTAFTSSLPSTSFANKVEQGSWNPNASANIVNEVPAKQVKSEITQTESINNSEPAQAKVVSKTVEKSKSIVAEPPKGPFEPWPKIIEVLQNKNPMFYAYLKDSKAYFDGKRVLIDGGDTFREYIRTDKDAQKLLKDVIESQTGQRHPIGPYTRPENTTPDASVLSMDEIAAQLRAGGTEVIITEN